jgi:hypothetical protein
MMGLDIESGFDFLRACGNDVEAEQFRKRTSLAFM